MARERNETLWAEWRDRVARYERRAETSAEFCRREDASVASLFSWRRRLAAVGDGDRGGGIGGGGIGGGVQLAGDDAVVLAGANVDSALERRGGRRTRRD